MKSLLKLHLALQKAEETDRVFHDCGCYIRLIITMRRRRRIKFQIQENGHIWQYTSVPEGQINILGGHSIGHPKQKKKSPYVHVSYSKWFLG
jgi:hypothetical protein